MNLIESKMNFIKVTVFASCVVDVDIVEYKDLYFSPLPTVIDILCVIIFANTKHRMQGNITYHNLPIELAYQEHSIK